MDAPRTLLRFLLVCAVVPLLGGQTTYLVTRSDDTAPGSGGVSGDLRFALGLANADPGSSVLFASALNVPLQAALPPVTTGLTIASNGPGFSVLDGAQAYLPLRIDAPGQVVNLAGLQLVNGPAAGSFAVAQGTARMLGAFQTAGLSKVGNLPGGSGAVVLDVSTAQWTTDGLIVGAEGTGTLTVGNNAALNVTSGLVTLGQAATGSGTLNIGAPEDTPAAAQGAFDPASITTGSGSGTVQFNHDGTLTLRANLSGNLALRQNSGLTILTGAADATVGTLIRSGTLQVGDGGTSGSIAGPVVNHGALRFNRSDDVTVAGVLSGNGNVHQDGSGTLTLIGENTFPNGMFVHAGRLQIGAGGTSGRIAGELVANGVVGFNRSDDIVYASILSGSGTLRQDGVGKLTIAGLNSFTGTTELNAGVLEVDSETRLGNIGPLRFNGGTLRFTGTSQSQSRTVTVLAGGGTIDVTPAATNWLWAGPRSGSGLLIKTGPGTLALIGPASALGGLRIREGMLQHFSSLTTAGPSEIGSSPGVPATLQWPSSAATATWNSPSDLFVGIGGPGSMTGAVDLFAASTTVGQPNAPGSINLSAGSITHTGGLVVGSGAGAVGTVTMRAQLRNPGGTVLGRGAGSSGTLDVNGSMSSGPVVVGETGQGSLTLQGALNAPSVVLGQSGAAGGTLNFGAPEGSPAGLSTTFTSTIAGGSGTGAKVVQVNLTNAVGNALAFTSDVSGVLLRLSSGQVTLRGNFSTSGPTTILSGGSLVLGAGGTAGTLVTPSVVNHGLLRFNRSDLQTFATDISGSGGVGKSQSNYLTLTGQLSYTGPTTIDAGALIFTTPPASSGFFIEYNCEVNFQVPSGIWDLPSMVFTGEGRIRKTGAGEVRWGSGSASFPSTLSSIFVNQGTLHVGLGGNEVWPTTSKTVLGLSPGTVFNGGDANVCVDWIQGNGTILSGDNASPTYRYFTFGANNGTSVYGGVLADNGASAGRYRKTGNGTQTLVGVNTYTGGTIIAGGTLQIGFTTSGSIRGPVDNSGTLAFHRTDAVVFDGVISGPGQVSQSGGTLTLTGASTGTGTLASLAGRIVLSGTWAGAFNVSSGARFSLAGGRIGSTFSSSVVNANGLVDGDGQVFGSVANNGTIVAGGAGQILTFVGGAILNTATGTLRAVSGGTLDFSASSGLTNNGLMDLISGQIFFPANFTNNGVLLDSRLVKVKSTSRVGPTVIVSIDGYSAHSYQLQRSTDLAAETFVNVGAPQAGITGSELTFTDPAASDVRGFYRVAVD